MESHSYATITTNFRTFSSPQKNLLRVFYCPFRFETNKPMCHFASMKDWVYSYSILALPAVELSRV